MKKIILVILTIFSVFILLTGCDMENVNKKKLNDKIYNLKKSKKVVPEFEILLSGKYEGIVDDLNISEIKLYDFDLDKVKNGKVKTYSFTGVKLDDVFDLMKSKDYKKFEIVLYDNVTRLEYSDKELEDAYLVFYENNKVISKEKNTKILSPNMEIDKWKNEVYIFVFDSKN